MKTKSVTGLLTAMILLFSVQLLSASEVSITVEKELEALYFQDNAYNSYVRTSAKEMTEAQVTDIAQKLVKYTSSRSRLEEAKMEKIDGRIFLGNAEKPVSTAYLDIDPTMQSLVFSKEMDDYLGSGDSKGLPDSYTAPKLAEIHLEAVKLLPANFEAEMTLLHIGGVGMATVNEKGLVEDYEKLVTVVYGRTLDGLPVKGGSRIVVRMGNNDELVGLVRNWPAVNKKAVSSKDMIASQNRNDHLRQHLEALYENSEVGRVAVSEASVVMYDDGKGTIEPAMFVLGEITQRDGHEEHADWIVPLLKRPRAKYTILERVPVYPDDHNVEPFQDIKEEIVEDEVFDK